MRGYRGFLIALVALVSSSLLVWAGIRAGVDLIGLATVVGAKDGTAALAIAGRGYAKHGEAAVITATNGHGPKE